MKHIKKFENKAFDNLFDNDKSHEFKIEQLKEKLSTMSLIEQLTYISDQYRLTISVVSTYSDGKINYFYVFKDTMSNGIITKNDHKGGYPSYTEAVEGGIKHAIFDLSHRS